MVVLRGINTVITPPCVSTPSDSGVTSNKRTSFTSPLSTPAWIAAPTATTSSGLTPRCGSLPNRSLTISWTGRHARLAADQNHFVDIPGADAGVLERLLHRSLCAFDQVMDQLLEF